MALLVWDIGRLAELPAPWIAFAAAVFTNSVTLGSGLWIWRGNLRAQRKDALRASIAEAVSAVMSWKEMPYRVARRIDDESRTKQALSDEFHSIQQQLSFHSAWMAVFDESVAEKFSALVRATKERSSAHIENAWSCGPRDVSSLGAKYDVDVSAEEAAFIQCARRKLR